jgi:hypothetical protein
VLPREIVDSRPLATPAKPGHIAGTPEAGADVRPAGVDSDRQGDHMPTLLLATVVALALQTVPFDPAVFKGPHVTIDGLVRHQGGYVLESGDTVGTVVGRAGGTTTEALPVYVLVRTRGKQVSCLAPPTESLESGDHLIVALKDSKMPMPGQSCDVALNALRRTQ